MSGCVTTIERVAVNSRDEVDCEPVAGKSQSRCGKVLLGSKRWTENPDSSARYSDRLWRHSTPLGRFVFTVKFKTHKKERKMTTETMTLTRALVESKAISGKLERVLNTSHFVTIAQGVGEAKKIAAPNLAGKTVDEVEASIKANYQSATDLIKRYNAIKRAIINANAVTKVKIGNEELTIAEAIERKNSIALEKGLLTALRQQNQANTQAVNTLTTRLNETIEKGIAQLYGSDRAKITDEQVKVVSDAKKKDFDPSLVDPLNVSKVIEDMIEKIESFETEVNFSLSEINSRTEITVQY